MKQKYIILLTIAITLIIITAGFFLYNAELDRNQNYYNLGYTNGLLYTQSSGNIIILDNGNLTEVPINQICNNINQQEVNK